MNNYVSEIFFKLHAVRNAHSIAEGTWEPTVKTLPSPMLNGGTERRALLKEEMKILNILFSRVGIHPFRVYNYTLVNL